MFFKLFYVRLLYLPKLGYVGMFYLLLFVQPSFKYEHMSGNRLFYECTRIYYIIVSW